MAEFIFILACFYPFQELVDALAAYVHATTT